MAHLSIRIDLAPGVRIGPGKVRLLQLIAESGSISAAGRALAMSYRRAWLLVDEMNRTLPSPVVTAKPGGRSGGGASLTSYGTRLVASYRAIEADAEAAAAGHLAAIVLPAEDGEPGRSAGRLAPPGQAPSGEERLEPPVLRRRQRPG